MSKHLVCWNCGESIEDIPLPISRHANCAHCFEVLHCCRLCRHYQPKASILCDHERADPPVIKENANFCDYFKPVRINFSAVNVDRAEQAKASLQSLFDGSQAEPDALDVDGGPDDKVNSRLDDLFDD